jgi:GDSL-like Lipase/Acylhydrolase
LNNSSDKTHLYISISAHQKHISTSAYLHIKKINNKKNMKIKYIITATLLLAGLLNACKPQLDAPGGSKGILDLSRYIAVGNSLTAGFADNGLYREGQLNSYPSIIAGQFKLAGGGDFLQPLFTETQANGTGYLTLTGFNPNGTPILPFVTENRAVRSKITPNPLNPLGELYTKYLEPINNLGVPGIRLSDLTDPTYGQKNPFYERLLKDDELTKTYLTKITESKPTFFTCWLGNNDVLQYAASGGLVPITPSSVFESLYNTALSSLAANGAKGAVANIPDVTSIPFLTTVTKKSIQDAIPGTVKPEIYIRTGAGKVRAIQDGDLILLTADSIGVAKTFNIPAPTPIPKGFSSLYPLGNEDVLDIDEVTLSLQAVVAYNTTIRNAAAARGLALVDANGFLKRFATPQTFDGGVIVSGAFISGGLFSLDGVHLTPRGYALAANEFIKAINSQYNASIQQAPISQYRGVKFP